MEVLKANKRARRRQKRKDERQAKAYLKSVGQVPSRSSSQILAIETQSRETPADAATSEVCDRWSRFQ